ncbi:hypothetical protein Efla_001535 [Eimeria flavescens]
MPGSSFSTGPAFWSYSYDSESLPRAAEEKMTATGSKVIVEPVDAGHLNRLVAAAMYSSIKQSLPYILHYNCTPESGPWYPQKEQTSTDAIPAEQRELVSSVRFQDTTPAACPSPAAVRRERPAKPGCC